MEKSKCGHDVEHDIRLQSIWFNCGVNDQDPIHCGDLNEFIPKLLGLIMGDDLVIS